MSRNASGRILRASRSSPPRGRRIAKAITKATQASRTALATPTARSHHNEPVTIGPPPVAAAALRPAWRRMGFGVQRSLFEVLQIGGRPVDGTPGGLSTPGGEVVAGGDLGQPASEALQVGFGLLDLGVGCPTTGALLGQFLAQRGDAFEDLGVFGVAGGVELLDHRLFLDGISEPHPQHPCGPALVVDPVG